MGECLFGCASSNDSRSTRLKPPLFISLERLEDSTVFIQKFDYAFSIPHELTNRIPLSLGKLLHNLSTYCDFKRQVL
jgi:hypothetical protein